MQLDVRVLGNGVGAEIAGVDLGEKLSDELVAAIADVWKHYGVILFRDQNFSLEQQCAITGRFGPIHRGPQGLEYMHIGNVDVNGVPGELPLGEMQFHQDGAYYEKPMRRTFLYALELPDAGGNTKFASTRMAFARLPREVRDRALASSVRFSYNYTATTRDAKRNADVGFTHPAVIVHPESGEPLLLCNRLMADTVIDVDGTESAEMLDRFCAALEDPDGVYEHVWRQGDFIAWDNLAVAHARTDFDATSRRLLRRTTTEGIRPVAYREATAVAK